MIDTSTSRRRFLLSAITFSAVIATGTGWLRVSSAWAQGALDGDAVEKLVRMARLLFPHDAIPDEVYSDVLQDILAAAAADPRLQSHLTDAVTALDEVHQTQWFDLDDALQHSALQAIEDTPYFAAIKINVSSRFYNHAKVWEHIGYPGPSVQFGGYVDKGFDDIDWLPEDA